MSRWIHCKALQWEQNDEIGSVENTPSKWSEKNNKMLKDMNESLFGLNMNVQPDKKWQRDERGEKKQMAAVSVG